MHPDFEEILRRHLKYLPADQELTQESSLRELGLDSMAAVTLMIDLEDAFGVSIPDSALMADTFHTPASLWAALTAARRSSRQ